MSLSSVLLFPVFFIFMVACGGGSVQQPILISGVIDSKSANEIVINNKHFDIRKTQISEYGEGLGSSSLRGGMRVLLQGREAGGSGVANHIEVSNIVKGTISKIVDDQSFVVLGQTVQITSQTQFSGLLPFESLTVGTEVTVNGNANYNGTIFADYIVLQDQASETKSVMGVVHIVDTINKRIMIGGLVVDYGSIDSLAEGELKATDWVETTGYFDVMNKRLVAQKIIVHPSRENTNLALEIRGVVYSGAVDDTFQINGMEARVTTQTSYKGGSRQSLTNLQPVLARGIVSENGVLDVEHIEILDAIKYSSRVYTARRWQVEEETLSALQDAEDKHYTAKIDGIVRWIDTDINEILLAGFTTPFFYTDATKFIGMPVGRSIGTGNNIVVEIVVDSGIRTIRSLEYISAASPEKVVVSGDVEELNQDFITIAGSKMIFAGSDLTQQGIDEFLSVADIGSYVRLEGEALSGNRIRWQSLSLGTTE